MRHRFLTHWVSKGMLLVTYSSDSGMLIEARRNALSLLRGAIAEGESDV
jgi:hypothetical protein